MLQCEAVSDVWSQRDLPAVTSKEMSRKSGKTTSNIRKNLPQTLLLLFVLVEAYEPV